MKPLLAAIVLLVLVGGGWYWYATHPVLGGAAVVTQETANGTSGSANASSTAQTGTDTGAPQTVDASASVSNNSAAVLHTGSGFAPDTITIKVGGTVTWTDADGSGMWVASNQHPSHTGYDGTSRDQHCTAGYSGPTPFDECGAGNRYSFTFTKAGTWGYHNHKDPNQTGTVVVVQ